MVILHPIYIIIILDVCLCYDLFIYFKCIYIMYMDMFLCKMGTLHPFYIYSIIIILLLLTIYILTTNFFCAK